MRFAFTEDQLLFRDAVRSLLAKECPPEAVRESWVSASGHLPDVWRGLAEMGVTGLLVPENAGGMGMSEVDLVLLLEEAGRAALPGPFVETVAVAPCLLALLPDEGERFAHLRGVADGSTLVTACIGTTFADHADVADLVIVSSGEGIFLARSSKVAIERQPSVDGARRLFRVDWSPADAIPLAGGGEVARVRDDAFDRGALGSAAQLLGLAEKMLDMTVDYVKQRNQFGSPIGSFQAVKHHLSDALLAVSFARPVVYNAAYSLAHRLADRSRDASMAKVFASDAAMVVARQALQCHGAIGYTVEYDLHLYMKRAWALRVDWGDADWHRHRIGVALGI